MYVLLRITSPMIMSDVDIYSDSQEESVTTSYFIENQEISDPSNLHIFPAAGNRIPK
jgi:hypothetical protein